MTLISQIVFALIFLIMLANAVPYGDLLHETENLAFQCVSNGNLRLYITVDLGRISPRLSTLLNQYDDGVDIFYDPIPWSDGLWDSGVACRADAKRSELQIYGKATEDLEESSMAVDDLGHGIKSELTRNNLYGNEKTHAEQSSEADNQNVGSDISEQANNDFNGYSYDYDEPAGAIDTYEPQVPTQTPEPYFFHRNF